MSSVRLTDIRIAPNNDYHILEGRSLYPQRYQKVMNFRHPGLAPVLDESGAFHIDIQGREAYGRKFTETFELYEGVAAVRDKGEWYHIDTRGKSIYRDRYRWCGNFHEGRSAVRDRDGRYFHITQEGIRLSTVGYSYVSDFRDEVAVVYNKEGKGSHIDIKGSFIHPYWYNQLDVFHNRFARAKDEQGWFHVTQQGLPAYDTRFASLEIFCNGHARAETLKGKLVVINEMGSEVK